MARFNRRSFVKTLVAGVATPYFITLKGGHAYSSEVVLDNLVSSEIDTDSLYQNASSVFDISVASGDPTPSGVILWTHIRPSAYSSNESLYFQVAFDPSFEQLTLEGEIAPDSFGPQSDYTIKLDLDGHLIPQQRYYYRFIYQNTVSRVGRCKTAPLETTDLQSLKLALLSCQDYTNGYYGALRALAEDNSIDFVVHLGDFIYESVGDPGFQDLPFEDRKIILPSGSGTALDLEDYRHLYKTYRSDTNLQLAMEQHTWIITTDDHETCNDCYWDYDRDTLGCPDHPYNNMANLDLRRQLKLDAQRAWAEYTPSRILLDASVSHPFDYSRIYRQFKFGQLLNLMMLDTRTYRSVHPCGEGTFGERYAPIGCVTDNPSQTMLGSQQREWLLDGLSHSFSRWNVLGNQTLMAKLGIELGENFSAPFNVDAWDGYEAERNLLLNEVRTNKVSNFVVLTGDLHTSIASEVKQDYSNIRFWNVNNYRGAEFMTPSVTSKGLVDLLSQQGNASNVRDFLLKTLAEGTVRSTNTHIKAFNALYYGYSTIVFTKGYCEWVAYKIDKNNASDQVNKEPILRYRKYEDWPWLKKMSIY